MLGFGFQMTMIWKLTVYCFSCIKRYISVNDTRTFFPQAAKFSQDPECGSTKGCYTDCAEGCTFEVAWEDKGTAVTFTIRFDLESKTNVWAAIGISQDMRMVSLNLNGS